MERAELLTFCALSPRDIDAARRVMAFEDMVNSRYSAATVKTVSPWSFADRTTVEKIPAHVFKQVGRGGRGMNRQNESPRQQLVGALVGPPSGT